MRADDAVTKALALVAEARDLLSVAEQETADASLRTTLADAGQVVGEARGNLAMILDEVKAVSE